MLSVVGIGDENRINIKARGFWRQFLDYVAHGNRAHVIAVHKMRGREGPGASLKENFAASIPGSEELAGFLCVGLGKRILAVILVGAMNDAAGGRIAHYLENFFNWLVK